MIDLSLSWGSSSPRGSLLVVLELVEKLEVCHLVVREDKNGLILILLKDQVGDDNYEERLSKS